ncbi:MAG TPA: AraC family transcriptional regulator [Burkholderiales bacterium]
MDALSDLLRVVNVNGALFLDSRFTAPWCVLSRPAREQGGIFAGAGHIIFFHVLTHGRCRVRLRSGGDTMTVEAGDLMLLAHDDGHLLGSDLHLAPVASDTLVRPAPPGGVLSIDHGGGGEETRFMCGFLACDPHICRPLLEALPRMLRVPLGQDAGAQWLMDLLRRGAELNAVAGPGSSTLLAKLAELLFVEAVRRYIASLPERHLGWLAGLRDPQVGRALALLHGEPGKAWTVDELARAVALSRSALAERFATLVGESPMQYLTRWRLALAAQALRSGGDAIARVAERSGYESEAAFSRAFRREFGVPPATWRRERKLAAGKRAAAH